MRITERPTTRDFARRARHVTCVFVTSCLVACHASPGPNDADATTRDATEVIEDASLDVAETGFVFDGPITRLCDPSVAARGIAHAAVEVTTGGATLLLTPPTDERRLYRAIEGEAFARWYTEPQRDAYDIVTCEGCPFFELGAWCGLRRLSEETSTCELAISNPRVAMLAPDLGFLAYDGRVLRFNGTFWQQLGAMHGTTGATRAIWSDGTDIVVAGHRGVVRGDQTGAFASIGGTLPIVSGGIELAGTSVSDLWWTSGGQLFHFDGAIWTRVWQSACAAGVSGVVQREDALMFWGTNYIGYVEHGSDVPHVQAECMTVRTFIAADGAPDTETIVVALEDDRNACGPVSLWRWSTEGVAPR